MKIRFILVAAAMPLIAACGIKGPPRPPEPELPSAPRDFRVLGREACALLSWKAPEPLPEGGYIVQRARVELDHPELHVFSERARVSEDTESFTDCELETGRTYLYRVAGLSREGSAGKPTGPRKMINLLVPATPFMLKAKSGDHFIELFWQMPEETHTDVGFQVYRGLSPGIFSWRPVNSHPIGEHSWADGGLENDRPYWYQVRAVALAEGSAAMEGPGSEMVQAVPVDRISPLAPRGLSIIPIPEGVILRWLSNHEPDLAGYNIYRKLNGDKSFQRINPQPIMEIEYLDHSPAAPGITIFYYITAQDKASEPNESKGSAIEKVFIPRP